MNEWENEHADRPTPQRGRKNRRRWCKGKVGVEHVPAVRVSKWGTHASQFWPDRKPCFRADWYPNRWFCHHEVYCTTCGKITRTTLDVACPDYTNEVTRFKIWRKP